MVLISDLLDDPTGIIDGLKHLRFRGSEVLVFHTLDPFELTFPFEHAARFEDLETADDVLAVPTEVREHYLEQMQGLVERYRRELRLADIDYQLVDTARPLDTAAAGLSRNAWPPVVRRRMRQEAGDRRQETGGSRSASRTSLECTQLHPGLIRPAF